MTRHDTKLALQSNSGDATQGRRFSHAHTGLEASSWPNRRRKYFFLSLHVCGLRAYLLTAYLLIAYLLTAYLQGLGLGCGEA